MKKQNIAIIAVVALVLAVSVGYALFNSSLTINGTAKASGSYAIEFTNIGTIKKAGYTGADDANIAVIAGTKNDELKITVNKLDYPGAYVEIPVTIENKGTIPVKLKNIEETSLTETNRAIKVSYTGIAASDTAIANNGTQNMTIRVEWDENVTDIPEEGATATFSIKLNYEQITAEQ